ncbi:hypothetical protein [Acidithiobacillus ferriphilus]|uniref:hypothetical protein n=1 Tax=Acidithiobacillus ferriphilus TaxID=1689834 RepID=UPI001C066D1B|nr:hypothetical protein [Acidithiobacillus ferriphilus]MBU2827099.1 hypothetical protein [Acidithiobacillus ferriphilus]
MKGNNPALLLSHFLDRPIAFHPILSSKKLLGGVAPALMLSQAIYWQNVVARDPDRWPGGYWWKTVADWQKETGLSESEQQNARRTLRKHKWWHEKLAGLPGKLHFRIDINEMAQWILDSLGGEGNGDGGDGGKTQEKSIDYLKKGNLIPENPRTCSAEKGKHSYSTKTTPKTTTTANSPSRNSGDYSLDLIDFSLIYPEIASQAKEVLLHAGLEFDVSQRILDEIAGQIRAGRARFPLKLLNTLINKAANGALETTSYGLNAREEREARARADANRARLAAVDKTAKASPPQRSPRSGPGIGVTPPAWGERHEEIFRTLRSKMAP